MTIFQRIYTGVWVSVLLLGASVASAQNRPVTEVTDVKAQKKVVLYFGINQSQISDDAVNQQALEEFGRLLEGKAGKVDSVTITAYTCLNGESSYNQMLSERRAKGLYKYFTERWPQVDPSIIAWIGGGENWGQLQEEIEADTAFPWRKQILEVLNSGLSVAEKKEELQKIAGGYAWRHLQSDLIRRLRNAAFCTLWLQRLTVAAPVLGHAAGDDGREYWTVVRDGKEEWLTDAEGNKVPYAGAEDAPVFGASEDADGRVYWTVTRNGETSWLTDRNGQRFPVRDADGDGLADAPVLTAVKDENGNLVLGVKDASGAVTAFPDGSGQLLAAESVATADAVATDTVAADTAAIVQQVPVEEPVTETEPVRVCKHRMTLKSNLLAYVLLMPNIGLEYSLGKRMSVAGHYQFAHWGIRENTSREYLNQGRLDLRYWLGNRDKQGLLEGGFVGLYGSVGNFDFMRKEKGVSADLYWSAGLTGGYSLPLNRSLGLEFELSAGYIQTDYTKSDLTEYDYSSTYKKKDYKGIALTRAAVTLVWTLFNSDK